MLAKYLEFSSYHGREKPGSDNLLLSPPPADRPPQNCGKQSSITGTDYKTKSDGVQIHLKQLDIECEGGLLTLHSSTSQ